MASASPLLYTLIERTMKEVTTHHFMASQLLLQAARVCTDSYLPCPHRLRVRLSLVPCTTWWGTETGKPMCK